MSKRSTTPSISASIHSIRSFHDTKDDFQHDLEKRRMFATSLAIERFTDKINRRSPINIRPVTLPVCKASTKRIHSLESFYIQSRLFRFLLRKGIPPMLLFVGTTSGIAWLLRRFYTRHRYLALNSLGVLYPAWRCWHLVKKLDTVGEPLEQLKECKTWLAYWLLYGSFQVLDNWRTDLEQFFPNYYIYKLIVLYWAQSPHSNGATILYQRVLQKPEDYEEEEKQQQQQQQHYEDDQQQQLDYYVNRIPSTTSQQQLQGHNSPRRKYQPLFNDNGEELTLTIGHPAANDDNDEYYDNHHESQQRKDMERVRSFRILDGYTPTLTNDEQHLSPYDSSCSSSSGNSRDVMGYMPSDEKNHLGISEDHKQQEQKQNFSTLVPMETETGW